MDLNDYSTQPKELNWKPIAIIGGGVLVAVLIIAAVFRFVGGQEAIDISQVQEDREASQTASILSFCEGEENVGGCVDGRLSDAAVKARSPSMCEELEDEAYDNCVWLVAVESGDVGVCELIVNEEDAMRCNDGISIDLALTLDEEARCDEIIDESTQSRCRGLFINEISLETCAEQYDDEACSNLELIETARELQDPDYCDMITSEELQDECLNYVGSGDRDFDGLSSGQEARYGTDDRNPDTDGDGYMDGDEVNAGYNPAGPGTL